MSHLQTALSRAAKHAQRVAKGRTAFETHDMQGFPMEYAHFHEVFHSAWYELIMAAAAKGMTGCSLPLSYPNPRKNELALMKQLIKVYAHSFFSESGFRIVGFGQWETIREFEVGSTSETESATIASIQTTIMISWRQPKK
ncbi:MAG: hypothetical protein JWL75_63 [Parcubacteria group bacterium]|nr:hypothetical protein [Parcubacteria group bacterium]